MPKIKPSEVLENFIRVVELLAPEEFTIKVWLEFEPEHDCGTTGCILGWAAQDNWFKSLGLKFVPWDGDHAPQFQAAYGLNAGRVLLGLDSSHSGDRLDWFLFSSLSYDESCQTGINGKSAALLRLLATLELVKDPDMDLSRVPVYTHKDINSLRELEKA